MNLFCIVFGLDKNLSLKKAKLLLFLRLIDFLHYLCSRKELYSNFKK